MTDQRAAATEYRARLLEEEARDIVAVRENTERMLEAVRRGSPAMVARFEASIERSRRQEAKIRKQVDELRRRLALANVNSGHQMPDAVQDAWLTQQRMMADRMTPSEAGYSQETLEEIARINERRHIIRRRMDEILEETQRLLDPPKPPPEN